MKLRPSSLAAPCAAPIPDALARFDHLPDSAFVRQPVVCALFSISPATAWRWVGSGILPTPRKLSPAISAWNVGQIRKALAGEAWQ